METFIYWCVNAGGVKTSFQSTAFLEVGMIIIDDYGVEATIIEMNVLQEIYDARYDAE